MVFKFLISLILIHCQAFSTPKAGRIAGEKGYLVWSEASKGSSSPSMILIPDWWGVSGFIKNEAEKLSKLGVSVFILDPFNGKTTTDLGEATRQADKVVSTDLITKLKKVFAAMAKTPKMDSKKIGVIGYGWGGKLAFEFASEEPQVKAAISIYGQPLSDLERLKKIKAPVLVLFGDKDGSVSPKTYQEFLKIAETARIQTETHLLKDAPRGFLDYTMSTNYNPTAASQANKFVEEFIKAHLTLTYSSSSVAP